MKNSKRPKSSSNTKLHKRNASIKRAIVFMIFVLMILVGVTFSQISSSYVKEKKEAEKIVKLKREIHIERQKHLKLMEQKEYICSKEYIENIAREKFGLIMPGEIIFIPKDTN
jgi:cell division protein FtsB